MKETICELYSKFLLESSDVEQRMYLVVSDQIEAELLHRYYVSTEDLRFCVDFDITSLAGHEFYEEIESLHEAVNQKFKSDNE